jgi:hypothetical protein
MQIVAMQRTITSLTATAYIATQSPGDVKVHLAECAAREAKVEVITPSSQNPAKVINEVLQWITAPHVRHCPYLQPKTFTGRLRREEVQVPSSELASVAVPEGVAKKVQGRPLFP